MDNIHQFSCATLDSILLHKIAIEAYCYGRVSKDEYVEDVHKKLYKLVKKEINNHIKDKYENM